MIIPIVPFECKSSEVMVARESHEIKMKSLQPHDKLVPTDQANPRGSPHDLGESAPTICVLLAPIAVRRVGPEICAVATDRPDAVFAFEGPNGDPL